ncbi:hypothetical protein RR46_03777 [Papilio xuthus]|uniref:FLYWCH-type domain-containing protein n=1 Tax=Papilio xuthus TaxID=66420 RepID=A0A194Q1F3_PAPXU|nr:hypothetical protein RR46_03777 [Papilio xuthus]
MNGKENILKKSLPLSIKEAFFLPSRAGKSILIFRSNKFWMNNQYRDKLNWACRDKDTTGCLCRVQTTMDGHFIRVKGEHNHNANFTPQNFDSSADRILNEWKNNLFMYWGVSKFGNPILVLNGQRFRRSGPQRGDRATWLCIKSDTGCKCYAVTLHGNLVAIGHNHVHYIKRRNQKRSGTVVAPETPPTLGLPFPFPCFPGQFRYCLSKRGKPAIEVGAHRFCFNGRAASGKVWWRCSRNPRCRAAVHTFGLRVVQMNSAHTCGVRATPLRPMF